MLKPKAINRKKLVAFVLPIIRKEKLPMSEELEKLRHKQEEVEKQWSPQLARRFVVALPREVPLAW